MTQLVLAAGGAVVGGLIGGPGGAQMGWVIGSAIGGAVAARGKTIRQEGPRLTDLNIASANYGGMLPILGGTMAVPGYLFWKDKIQEHSTTTSERQGKGGGPKVETTTYTYTLSCAIALGDCRAGACLGVRRFWINGELAYSVGDDADAATLAASGQAAGLFKFYSGDETQLPDPTLEAVIGAGKVPAMRGVAYVVFTDSSKIINGNQLLPMKFEVVMAGTAGWTNKVWNGSAGFVNTAGSVTCIPPDTDEVLYFRTDAYSALYGQYWMRIEVWSASLAGNILVSQFSLQDQYYSANQITGVSDEPGILCHWQKVTDVFPATQNSVRFIRKDGGTVNFYHGAAYKTYCGSNTTFSKNGNYLAVTTNKAQGQGYDVLLFDFTTTALIAARRFSATGTDNLGIYRVLVTSSFVWVLTCTSANDLIAQQCSLVDLSTIATFTFLNSTWIAHNNFGGQQLNVSSCQADDSYYLKSGYAVRQLNPDGTFPTVAFDIAFLSPGGDDLINVAMPFQKTAVGYVFASDIITSQIPRPYIVANALTRSATTAAAEITKFCELAGIDASEIDVSAMTEPVPGYGIYNATSARACIEPLLRFAYADAVEVDGKLKFVKRGAPITEIIPYDDLGAHEFGAQMPEPFPLTRAQESDLPRSLTLNFIDMNNDYQPGTERAPASTVLINSQNDLVDEIPIACSAAKAAQCAEIWYYDAITARQARKFSLLRKWSKLVPTDVAYVEYPRGTYNPIRITKAVRNGPVIDFECVAENAAAYTSVATGNTPAGGQTLISPPGPTYAQYLDIPILQDSDDNAGFYVAMTGASTGWTGAVLARSPDDVVYADLGLVNNNAVQGFTTTTLADWTGGNVFDEVNTVDVTLIGSGALSSATRDAVLNNGANACVIGAHGRWEVLQFKTATLISAGKYRLSGLLRGRKGTEQYQSVHTSTDTFVLLGVAGTLRPNEGNSAIGQQRYYRPVSVGRTLGQTLSQAFTNSAVGLRPLSPVNLRGARDSSGNLTITLDRRTRYNDQMRDGVDVPLGEASELYDLEIYSSSSYTTIMRTLTGVAYAGLMYSSANQVTDFGSNQAAVYVKIYQKSTVVGRGYSASKGV